MLFMCEKNGRGYDPEYMMVVNNVMHDAQR